jgi:CheY-like chemotaxis protein
LDDHVRGETMLRILVIDDNAEFRQMARRMLAISATSPRLAYLKLAMHFGARRILQKPFTQAELVAAVTDVLAT